MSRRAAPAAFTTSYHPLVIHRDGWITFRLQSQPQDRDRWLVQAGPDADSTHDLVGRFDTLEEAIAACAAWRAPLSRDEAAARAHWVAARANGLAAKAAFRAARDAALAGGASDADAAAAGEAAETAWWED